AAALAAGLAVLVEKPMALDVGSAERLSRAVAATGGVLVVDHVRLFSPAYRALRGLVADAGPITRIDGVTGNPPGADAMSPLWDLAPHDCAMALDLVGEAPISVGAVDAAGAVRVELGFAGGATASCTVGNRFDRKQRRFEVRCGRATFVYDEAAPVKLA